MRRKSEIPFSKDIRIAASKIYDARSEDMRNVWSIEAFVSIKWNVLISTFWLCNDAVVMQISTLFD